MIGLDLESVPAAIAIFTVAVVLVTAGLVVGVIVGRRRQPARSPQPSTAPPEQRAAIIKGCLKVRALLDDPLLADMLDESLRDGGVSLFDPTGQPADPARHRIDHTVPAPEPGRHGLIAHTLIPGYSDDGRVLRPADVVVYKWERT
jgi:hypothetical protein